MIIQIEMFGCQCDNCGKQWMDEHNGFVAFADKNSMENIMGDDTDWYTDREEEEDKHYCPGCFTFDDYDNLVLKPMPPKTEIWSDGAIRPE